MSLNAYSQDNFVYKSPSQQYNKIIEKHNDVSNIENIGFMKINIKTRIKHQMNKNNAFTSDTSSTVGGGVVIESGTNINGNVYINIENQDDINVLSE